MPKYTQKCRNFPFDASERVAAFIGQRMKKALEIQDFFTMVGAGGFEPP